MPVIASPSSWSAAVRRTELVLVCEGGPGGRVTLPVAWTDRAPVSLEHRLAVEGLAELSGLAAALGDPPVASEDRA